MSEMPSIRVGHIIAGLGFGGAERNLVNLLNALDCEHKSVIIIGAESTGASLIDQLKPSVEIYRAQVRRRSLPFDLLRLVKVIRKSKLNVVHTHMYQSNLYGTIAAQLAAVPVVVTSEHGENPWKNNFHHVIERQIISRIADIRFCVSPRIMKIRREVDRIPGNKLKVVPNATVLPEFCYRPTGTDAPVIASVGRLIDAKDYPVLLKAAAILKERGYKFSVQIAGDGPERADLERQISKLDLGEIVRLHGLVTDTTEFYKSADIYVISSKREGLPIALLEAMSFGIPTVATDVGAIAEVVRHNMGGLIVAPGSPEQLADALEKVIDSEELRISLSKGGRARIEEDFSVDNLARRHIQKYEEILTRKTSS